MKKYLISLGYILISFFILTFLVTLLNYFDVISGTVLKALKMIISIISIFVGGIYLGINSIEKGYLKGIKLGLIFVLLIFSFSFLGLDKSFDISRLVYYLIIISTSMLGSMIGINKSPKNKAS